MQKLLSINISARLTPPASFPQVLKTLHGNLQTRLNRSECRSATTLRYRRECVACSWFFCEGLLSSPLRMQLSHELLFQLNSCWTSIIRMQFSWIAADTNITLDVFQPLQDQLHSNRWILAQRLCCCSLVQMHFAAVWELTGLRMGCGNVEIILLHWWERMQL